MSILDTTAYFNGDMDKWIEKHRLFDETFKKGVLSVLLVDPDNQMPIKNYPSENPEIKTVITFFITNTSDFLLA